jgi:hypothetical protein
MPLYLCKWSDGDLTIIAAKNKPQAIKMLDEEYGEAKPADLTDAKNFMLNLRLTKNTELMDTTACSLLEIESWGFGAHCQVNPLYPVLNDRLELATRIENNEEAFKFVAEAVEIEKKRRIR